MSLFAFAKDAIGALLPRAPTVANITRAVESHAKARDTTLSDLARTIPALMPANEADAKEVA